jgi:hypothetical protein
MRPRGTVEAHEVHRVVPSAPGHALHVEGDIGQQLFALGGFMAPRIAAIRTWWPRSDRRGQKGRP